MRFRTRRKPHDALPNLTETAPAVPDAAGVSGNGERPRRPPRRGLRARIARFRTGVGAPDSPVLIYLGLAMIVAGFGTIAFTWSKVAGTLAVPLQLPYLVSGGFVGLGMVLVGVAIINIGTKRRDASAREERLERLRAALQEISRSTSNEDESDKVREA